MLRLNFAAYVTAIKSLGYELLFPDLYSPSSRSPLGNRFYKQFKPILTSAGITEEGLGSHAVRHLFGAQLKKKSVVEEDLADLLGHGGKSETSERYCEPHEIATLLKFVEKLPVETAHLQPHEVKLLPWVLEKEVSPFSQPSRARRNVREQSFLVHQMVLSPLSGERKQRDVLALEPLDFFDRHDDGYPI